MFHIGVATQHPPLPDNKQLSEKGIDFLKQCLTISPEQRPSALELMEHPWMLDFQDLLKDMETVELAAGLPEMASDPAYASASVARQAAIERQKEIDTIQSLTPNTSPANSPTDILDPYQRI